MTEINDIKKHKLLRTFDAKITRVEEQIYLLYKNLDYSNVM